MNTPETETTVVNADGSKVTTLIDKTGGGVKTVTKLEKLRFTFAKAA